MKRVIVVLVVLFATQVQIFLTNASAHPLGGTTINRYMRVEISASAFRVYYILDAAEIPTASYQSEIDDDRDAFQQKLISLIMSQLYLNIDGQVVELTEKNHLLSQPVFADNKRHLRFEMILEAPAGQSNYIHTASIADDNLSDVKSWREVIVTAKGNARVENSSVPAVDTSQELHNYPTEKLQDPSNVKNASFRFDPGDVSVSAKPLTAGEVGKEVATETPKPGERLSNLPIWQIVVFAVFASTVFALVLLRLLGIDDEE